MDYHTLNRKTLTSFVRTKPRGSVVITKPLALRMSLWLMRLTFSISTGCHLKKSYMLSSHAFIMLKSSSWILHGCSLSHYWECTSSHLVDNLRLCPLNLMETLFSLFVFWYRPLDQLMVLSKEIHEKGVSFLSRFWRFLNPKRDFPSNWSRISVWLSIYIRVWHHVMFPREL